MNFEAKMLGRDEERLALPGEGYRRRGWIRWAIGAVLVLVALAAAFYAFGSHPAGNGDAGKGAAAGKPGAPGNVQIPSVTVMTPGKQNVSNTVSGTGSLAAKRDMPVGVAGEGGMVTRVLVEPGAWVRKGQVLATVDRSVQVQTAESLEAQVRVAQADADLAQSELERAQSLVGRGFISKADLDRKQATRDSALARVRVAKATLAETRARNGRLDIRAPEAGLVLTRTVEPGQVVSAGSGVLFRIAMGGQLELRTQLSEADLQRVQVGAAAHVTPVGAGESFAGKVWQVSPVIDPQTRQGVARVELPYNAALRPGGFANATITVGNENAPLLPESAVLSDAKGNYVYVLDGDNKVVRRAVTVGDVSDAGVAIASGLKGDERVVVSAGAFLNPGQKVKPVRQRAAPAGAK